MRLTDIDAFIEKIGNDKFIYVGNDYASGFNDGIFHAEVVADNFPTVDAVPVRHGKWTADETLYTQGMVACSCCKTEYNRDDIDMVMPKYCPNCGARMDGERKEE